MFLKQKLVLLGHIYLNFFFRKLTIKDFSKKFNGEKKSNKNLKFSLTLVKLDTVKNLILLG